MIAELVIAATLASHYAGKPVTLTCDRYPASNPTLGEVFPGDTKIHLNRVEVCGALRRPARTPKFAAAVLTVIHESFHARGDENEDRVECDAARRTPAALYRWFGIADTRKLVKSVTFRPECVA